MRLALHFVRQHHEADATRSFLFEPDPPFTFRAGQYLRYLLPHAAPDERGVWRSFTIAASPAEPLVRLATRLTTPSSSFKAALARLEPGDVVDATGPHGRFVYADETRPAVFIAGGIGITPYRSILGDLAARNHRANVTLLYSNHTPDLPFRSFFDRLNLAWPELRVVYSVTRPHPDWHGLTGQIDAALIRQHVADLAQPLIYIAGPPRMVEAVRDALAVIGVDHRRIKQEAFAGYAAPAATSDSARRNATRSRCSWALKPMLNRVL